MTNRTIRTISLFMLQLCTLQAWAQQSTNKAVPFVKITKAQYEISCPGSWAIDSSKIMGMDLFIRSPRKDTLDNFSENMNVFVQDLQGQQYTLTKMGQESETQIKNMVTDAEILESRLVNTTAQQFYLLRYKGRQGKFMLTTIQKYYFKNEVGYAVTFTIQQENEEAFIEIADKMFDSFKLR